MAKIELKITRGEVNELASVIEQVRINDEKTSFLMARTLKILAPVREETSEKIQDIRYLLADSKDGKIVKNEKGEFAFTVDNEKELNKKAKEILSEVVSVEVFKLEINEEVKKLPVYVKSVLIDKLIFDYE